MSTPDFAAAFGEILYKVRNVCKILDHLSLKTLSWKPNNITVLRVCQGFQTITWYLPNSK